jgi:hypothetical protein
MGVFSAVETKRLVELYKRFEGSECGPLEVEELEGRLRARIACLREHAERSFLTGGEKRVLTHLQTKLGKVRHGKEKESQNSGSRLRD